MQDAFCLLPDTCVGEFGVGIEKDVGRLAVKAHDQAGIAAFGEDLLVDALPVDVGRAQAGVVGTDADFGGAEAGDGDLHAAARAALRVGDDVAGIGADDQVRQPGAAVSVPLCRVPLA